MEDESDSVAMGRQIHEESYKRERKNLIIDGKIALDFVRDKDKLIIHEVKKDTVLSEVHRTQLQYYLWYVKEILGIWPVSGVLTYPAIRYNESVELDHDAEIRLKSLFALIDEIIILKNPPKPVKKKICTKCAYYEFCWVE